MQNKSWFRPWFLLLTGWVIGAWFFAIPRTMYEAGIIPAITIIICVWCIVTLMHLILWEVALSLPGHKTFIWIANALFPRRLARATSSISILNNFIWILAYILLWWSFLHILVQYIGFSLDPRWTTALYVIILWSFALLSTKALNKRDSSIVIVLLVCMWIIMIVSTWIGNDIVSSISETWSLFKVYGITLFALSSINTIPILYHTTGSSAVKMRNVIIASGFAVTCIAIFFWLAVISMSGWNTSENSISWLAQAWITGLWVIGSILWLAAIISSHIPTMEHLEEIFSRDWKYNNTITRVCVALLPFIIILYFNISLLQLLSVAGSLLGWLLFILVCLLNIYLHRSSQKVKVVSLIENDQFWSRCILVLCALWVLYQILSFYPSM
jgi:amino acid permease